MTLPLEEATEVAGEEGGTLSLGNVFIPELTLLQKILVIVWSVNVYLVPLVWAAFLSTLSANY